MRRLAFRTVRCLATTVPIALAVSSFAQSYGWRGTGDGQYPSATPPLEWSGTSNVAWKTTVGGSYSSPVVVGDRVIVTAEPDRVLCLNAGDGKVVWSVATTAADLPGGQRTNVVEYYHAGTSGNAAATPASDGQRVFAVFGDGLVTALDLKTGKRLWIRHVATPPTSLEGRSASPVLAGGRLLVHLTTLRAFEPESGKLLWTQDDALDSYGTPVAAQIGAVEVVVTPRGDVVRVKDGKILASGFGSAVYSSPIVSSGTVCLAASSCVAVRLPEAVSNDSAVLKEIWSDTAAGEVYGSPVLCEGRLYVLTGDGKLDVFDLKAGTKSDIQLELCGGGSGGGMGGGPVAYASLSLAANHLFASDDSGATVVLTLGKEPKPVKVNRLPEGSGATPAFAADRIFARSGETLCCIRK